ncbi:MAG: hypothetical protein AAFY57_15360 [Cyanobacteria bacterium J06642_2]
MIEQESFPIDGELLRILPRAGAYLRNPEVRLPKLRADRDGYFIEIEVQDNPEDPSETKVTRRLPLGEDITEDDWEQIQSQFEHLDFQVIANSGVSKGLEKLKDERLRRLIVTLLTFLNPRQVAILIYLYRAANIQNHGSTVTFKSNDLLESLGYKRGRDGSFHQSERAKLNRDLVSLHRVELLFAESHTQGDAVKTTVKIRRILQISQYDVEHHSRDFDPDRAADYSYELADSYTVKLEFFSDPDKSSDFVLFPNTIDIRQKLGNSASHDYRTKLITYLANRLAWDRTDDMNSLFISKTTLLKNLGLQGKNKSRNSALLWRTIHDIQAEGFIVSARELSHESKRHTSIQLQINPDMLFRGIKPSV